MLGIPLLEKILGFMVLKFLGFLVSKYLGFKVSWFLGFEVSKIYKKSISCYLEDTDSISKILKNLLDRWPGFSAPVFSTISNN